LTKFELVCYRIHWWKIRCTDESGTSQYIENKIYRRLSSTPSLSARPNRCPRLWRGILFGADGTSLLRPDAENKMISERSERTSFRS